MHTSDVSTADFQAAVIDRSKEVPVVVDFWASWCGPCKVLGPILEKAADEAAGSFRLAKVDVDRNQALAAQFGVQGIPTVIGFRDGHPVSRFTGAIPEAGLRKWLEELLPSEVDRAVAQAQEMISGGREEEAEALLRKVLTDRPDHPAAGLMVASLLLDRDEPEAALEVLERLPATPDVTRLMAGARLGSAGEQGLPSLETAVAADPEDHAARISLGRALMTAGRPQEGLERLLEVIEAKNDWSDEARQAFLDVLEVLGADHVLAVDYRRRLANALF